jgi:hypothetical protein
MAESQRKRRPVDELERIPVDAGEADSDQAGRDPIAAVQALQRQAGNAAVSSILSATKAAPKAGGGQGGAQKAGGTQASPDSFEAQLFDQSILDPMRALYAVVRDPAPDANVALEKLMPIGEALFDYYERYRGRDDGLSNAFLAARGWLVPAVDALRRRVGPVRPWTDEQIASRIQEAIDDMKIIREKLG